MKNQQYLTFNWDEVQYGIEVLLVQEMFPIPELTLIDEASTEMILILNLRGQIVPIIYLDLFQNKSFQGFNISDYIIVIQCDTLPIGLVVHQVNELLEVRSEVIEAAASSELIDELNCEMIAGVTKVDKSNIFLLDYQALMAKLDAVLPLIWDAQMQLDSGEISSTIEVEQQGQNLQNPSILSNFYNLYCPNATPEERAIFRQRADKCRTQIASLKGTEELVSLAVIGFGNQYFGLDLELVREFSKISNLTPIPGCPNHIVGNMNLRGEIVTLVDIRNALNLPTSTVSIGSPAVVVQVDEIVAGLPVDQVLEMAYLNSTDMIPLSGVLSNFGEAVPSGNCFFSGKNIECIGLSSNFYTGRISSERRAYLSANN